MVDVKVGGERSSATGPNIGGRKPVPQEGGQALASKQTGTGL